MAPVKHNPVAWTGDVKGSAPYKAARAALRIATTPVQDWPPVAQAAELTQLAVDRPMKSWPSAIWRDIQRKPMAYSAPLYLAGSTLLGFAGHVEHNYYMMAPALTETSLNVALMMFGDGGDQTQRTEAQIQQSEKFEKSTWAITTVLGAIYTAGGIFNHGGEIYGSEISLGLFTTMGAVVGLASKKPENPTDFRDVGRTLRSVGTTIGHMAAAQLRRDDRSPDAADARRARLSEQFGETRHAIANLSPYKKMGGVWFGATLSLLPEFLKTHDPIFVPCLLAFGAANALICMSEKAEPDRPAATAEKTDTPHP